jgi:hypothetical protein
MRAIYIPLATRRMILNVHFSLDFPVLNESSYYTGTKE